jgi:apolipoprotein N-acyltransferase
MLTRTTLILFAAIAILPFSNGRWSFALATWVAPALLLAFMREAKHAFLGGWIATSIASFFWWRGVVPIQGVASFVASIVFGLIALLPYLADRAIAPRIGGLLGTLVFPCAFVTLETITMLFSPFSSWGSLAYTQFAVRPLVQFVSITGLAGLTFLITWFASVANTRTRSASVAYAIVVFAALVFGFIRLQSSGAKDSVRVAAITPRIPTYAVRGEAANAPISAALQSVRTQQPLPNEGWIAFRKRAADIEHELLNATEAEARRGAKLIVWSEGAGVVERRDEPAMIARAAEVARRTGGFIALSFLTLDANGSKAFENKNVLIDAAGRTIWTYHKTRPVPGMEACVPGDGRIPIATTPYGRVATAICFDLDFPRLIRQVRADIMLVPADDWREIAPRHSYMAAFRAVEQGFTLVRSTSNGLSLAIDRYGRVQAAQDYFAGARVMHTNVPCHGAPTIYARTGDVVPAGAAVLLVALFFYALLNRSQRAGVRAG